MGWCCRGGVVVLAVVLLVVGTVRAVAQPVPSSEIVAASGELYIPFHGRLCPLDTYSRAFLTTIYGRDTYHSYDALTVLMGWLIYPEAWKKEPMILVTDRSLREMLGLTGRYASVMDFVDADGNYLLAPLLDAIAAGDSVPHAAAIRAADDRLTLLDDLYVGDALRLFPWRDGEGDVEWYAPTSALPDDMPIDNYVFTRHALAALYSSMEGAGDSFAITVLRQLADYQHLAAGDMLPSPRATAAELWYNRHVHLLPWAIVCLVVGIASALFFMLCLFRRRRVPRYCILALAVVAGAVALFLLAVLILRGVLSSHLPVASGYEMLTTLSCLTLLLSLACCWRWRALLPSSLLTAGVALLIATASGRDPLLTPLVPALQTPLLAAHVVVIILAYMLFAFILLHAVAALVLLPRGETYATLCRQIRSLSEVLLSVAVALLAAGIIIGAIWAKHSWGRYWGWDAKETTALLTLLVYAVPLFRRWLPWLRRDRNYHLYVALAFVMVVVTYFLGSALSTVHGYAQ